MKRLMAVALLAGILCMGASCGGDGPTASGPGTLKVRLTSPNSGADSAIVLTIAGPAALTSATAGTGLRLFQQPLGGTTTRFALTGQLNNGATILTIGVADIGALSQYSGAINGIATPVYALRVLPGGYALAITR
ncbi:MAG TPA: hypothetical protein VL549_11680 [Gemmatimonadales bacterium]|jgi:hypothetical protein|nr:hypothetical protein [Gemmatimonadales bacterium]